MELHRLGNKLSIFAPFGSTILVAVLEKQEHSPVTEQILIRVRYLILRYTAGTQKSFSRKIRRITVGITATEGTSDTRFYG